MTRWIVTLALLLGGCDDTTGLSRLTFPMLAAGVERDAQAPLTLTTDTGWQVTLSEARVALGPFYLNTEAPPQARWRRLALVPEARADVGNDQIGAGRTIGQVLERVVIDGLDPRLQVVGQGEGLSETAHSADALLLPPLPGAAGVERDVVARVAGVATKSTEQGPKEVRFRGQVALGTATLAMGQTLADLRSVRRIGAVLELRAGGALTLRVDPRRWLRAADFTPLLDYPPDPADAEGRRLARADDGVGHALYQGLRARDPAAYQFRFQPASTP